MYTGRNLKLKSSVMFHVQTPKETCGQMDFLNLQTALQMLDKILFFSIKSLGFEA